jgi:hypothetical protein
MIFTSRFGALAARPDFHELARKEKFDRDLDELLKDADLESATER